jgi:sulfatase modifying factor 1
VRAEDRPLNSSTSAYDGSAAAHSFRSPSHAARGTCRARDGSDRGSSFEMGSTDGRADDQPVHTVRLTRPFLLGKYEVTFDEYDLFCQEIGSNRADDAGFGRGRVPVQNVDWYGAVAYCNWLSEKHALTPCYSGKGKGTQCDFTADGYRLPTEAEWEYAARGGRKSQGYTHAGSNDPDKAGWYEANSGGRTHEVGGKASNELGLYDMSGNVFEWCWDWYAVDYYASSPADDPQGPSTPPSLKPWELTRSRPSGCWREDAASIRTTTRSFDTASYPGENGLVPSGAHCLKLPSFPRVRHRYNEGHAHTTEAKIDRIAVLKRHPPAGSERFPLQPGAVRAFEIEQIVARGLAADACMPARDRVPRIVLGEVEVDRGL